MEEKDINSAVTEYLNQKEPSEDRFALRTSLGAAMEAQPDFEAEMQKLSAETGVPLETAKSMPDQIKTQAKINAINYDELAADFPRASKFLSDPQNASVSHDDIGVMQKLENGWKAFRQGIEKGSIQDELGNLNYADLEGSITPEQQARREKLKADMGYLDKDMQKDDSGLSYFLGQTGYSGRQMVGSIREGAKAGLAGATAGVVAATIAGQMGPQVAFPEEIVTVPGAAALGGRAGFVAGSAVAAYKMEAGFAWDEFKDIRGANGQPLDPSVARGAAMMVGLVNGGLELVGEYAMLKMFPGFEKMLAMGPKTAVKELLKNQSFVSKLAQFGKTMIKTATIEGLTEAVQELSTIMGGETAKLLSPGQFEPITPGEAGSRMGQNFADAFVGSVGLGLAGGAANRVYDSTAGRIEARRMQQNADLIRAIGDTAKESKLLERMPEKYQELVRTIKEGGDVENVFIPAEQFNAYFQSKGVDPEIVAQEVGASNYKEATAAGTDVMIPVENYASTIAKTEHHDALVEDIRFHQSDLTMREYAESLLERKEQEKKLQELAQQELKTEEQIKTAEAIKTQFAQNLIDVGTDRSTAEAYATSYAKAIVNLAERAGMEPMALAEQYGLSVSRPLPGVLTQDTRSDINIDPMIDAIRAGKIPSEREVYGKNLIEFIKEKGGINPELGGRGELASFDEGKKGFARITNKQSKYSLDKMAEAAVESGYFNPGDFEGGTPTEAEMLDAIERGEAIYSAANTNYNLEQYRNQLEMLRSHLQNLGIDLSVIADNPTVRRMMEQAMENMRENNPEAFDLFQRLTGKLPETIDVNGVQRPTVNSEGKQIGRTEEEVRNFWNWFGDSKVVDEQGRPLVVYHGTNEDFDTFDRSLVGEGNGNADWGPGFYFASDRKAAEGYGSRIVEAYLKIDRPADNEIMMSSDVQMALDDGMGFTSSDEVLTENGYDGISVQHQDYNATEYVVFNPEQIKSATSNAGTFDTNNPSILYQSATIRSGKETLKKYGLTPGEKYKTREVAAALEARQRTKYGIIDRNDRGPKAVNKIAKWMQAEVEFEMENPEKSGVGWYSKKFQTALDTMAQVFPELATDKTARDTMTALIAITSDGQKVVPNFAQAMDIYGNFRKGGATEGKFTTSRGHIRQASIDNNMKVLQGLYDKMGAEAMHQFLMQEKTVSELKKIAKESGQELKSDYQAHIKMPMAAVAFGPKLGAFYANLMGAHGYLTMDRWWSRTFNRYRGTLLTAPTQAGLKRFKELLGKPEISDDEAIAATVQYRKSYEDRGFKNGSEIEKAANTIYKEAFEAIEDAPFTATDRTFMLDAVNKTQQNLKKEGYDLSIADIQAILWYYEKRLYGELGARQSADISYEEAAKRVVSSYASGSGVESILGDQSSTEEDAGLSGAGVSPGEEQYNEASVSQPGTLYQGDRNLLIQHNLTASNLQFADRLGGLAAPSLAVTKVDAPLTNFGEITLIGPKSMADPKSGTRVFGADIYSPRYPDVVYKFKASAIKNIAKTFAKEMKIAGDGLDENELKRSGVGYLENKPWAMMKFLEVEGVEANIAYNMPDEETQKAIKKYGLDKFFGVEDYNLREDPEFQKAAVDAQIDQYKRAFDEKDFKEFSKAIEEDEGYRRRIIREWSRNVYQMGKAQTNPEFDYAGTRNALRDQIKELGKQQAFVDYLTSVIERENPDQKIERISDSGTRRYLDHTIENVVAILKKELRGGEDFNYGVGSIRSKYAPEFKSVSSIKKAKDRLVSKVAFDSIKKEIDEDFSVIAFELEKNHPSSGSFRYIDAVSMMMTDAATFGIPGALTQNQFKGVSRENIERIAEFLDKLKTLPTEYFEAKILRGVDIGEFAAAVVPVDADEKTKKILEDKGLKVFEYGGDETQSQAITRASNEMADQILFQSKDENRGYIQIGKDRKMNIALLEKADLSTMLHELGHFYLEVLQDLASSSNAPAQMQADFRTLLDWFGVTPEQWASFNLEQRREYHEKFARAHEAYLMEGKAPSEELRTVFARFKDWLKLIYKQLTNLNVNLTDEVRSVFDRIYASDNEIEMAKKAVPTEPLFTTAEQAGLSEAEFEAYKKSIGKQAETAREALLEKLMVEKNREQKEWWKKAKADMTAEVTAEVEATPVYRAFAALSAGKLEDGTEIKLNSQALSNRYGIDYSKRIPSRLKSKVGGMDADAAAQFLGYESGDKLIEDLVGMKPKNEFIKAEVDDRMIKRYGDMMLDGSISDQAKTALHNKSREQVLMTELKLIAKKKREVQPFVRAAMQDYKSRAKAALDVPPIEFFRETAKNVMDGTLVKDIVPYSFLRAQQKASKQALSAMASGDFETAQKAKERELLNHHLYLEAVKAKEDADKILDYAKKFDTRATRERIGKAGGDYLQQIDAILDRYEFRRIPLSQLQKRRALLDWANEQAEQGEEPAIDERILDEARQVNYREVPISELRAVRDAVKNIEHIARFKNKLIANGKRIEFEDALKDLIGAAEENGKGLARPIDPNLKTTGTQIADKIRSIDAGLLKMEQLVRWLDGGNVNGPWHTYLWNPIAEAQFKEYDLQKKIGKKIQESFDKMPKEQRVSMLDTYDVPGIGKVTKKFIMSMAFNMGNQENIDKMMNGHGWSMTVIEEALQNLNSQDWQFVQETWDTISSLWPEIAALEKRMSGLEPPKVQAQPYTARLRDGGTMELRGGYFPLKYDPNYSEQGAKQESGNLGQMFEQGYVRATTSKGHTKARTQFAAPLLMDFEQVITGHLTQVIKDLTHREAIVSANKIITNREIRGALQRALGVEYERQFMPWLRSVVNDRTMSSIQGSQAWTKLGMQIRANVVAATMGYSATTAITQLVGLSASMDMVKPKYLAQAFVEYMKHPVKVKNEISELSGEIRNLEQSMDRDIRAVFKNFTTDDKVIGKVREFAFHGIALADSFVKVPTWLGAYRQAIAEGKTKETAILEADAAVRMTQGAGGAKDLAAIQRSNEFTKTITMFYSYFNVLYNRMRDMGHEVQEIRDMPKFLARAFFTVMVPAVMGDLIVGRGPDDDEDDALWVIRKMLLYPTLSVPILKDIVSSIDSGYDYRFSPISTGLEKIGGLAKATGKLASDKMEWGDYCIKATDTIGFVAGVPGTTQATRTMKYLWRVEKGEENPDNILELIGHAAVGKKPEK